MIKAVIFDCFGVFYIDPFRMFIAKAAPEVRDELRHIMLQNDVTGLPREEIIARYAELTHIPTTEVAAQLYGVTMARNQQLMDYAEGLRQVCKVALLSNVSPGAMDNYFTQEDRQKLFDDVVLSSEVGLVKPQLEIFELAAQRLGIAAEEAVFVDDTPVNCDAARAVGMQAITFTDMPALRAQLDQMVGRTHA